MEEDIVARPDAENEATAFSRLRRWPRTSFQLLSRAFFKLKIPLAAIFSAIVFQILAALFPSAVEHIYARPIYPLVVGILSFFSRRFGFSVAEVFVTLSLLFGVFCAARLALLAYFRPAGRRARAVRAAKFITWLTAIALWVFLLVFGLNYERPLLFDMLGFERVAPAATELEMMSEEIINRINESYDEAHSAGRPAPSAEEIVRLLEESYGATPELSLLPHGSYAQPKPVYLSGVMTRFGISGIYFPFTAEPNYNAEEPDFQLPFTMAHEMAHQRGVARESEANFVAFLVCINSSDPFIRYSGYRNATGVLLELFRKEPEKARDLVKQLGAGYREDSKRAAIFWARANGFFGRIGSGVNDLYLRANRIKSGTDDYAASTTLIIGYYRKRLSP